MHTAFGDPVGIAERLQTRPFYSPRGGHAQRGPARVARTPGMGWQERVRPAELSSKALCLLSRLAGCARSLTLGHPPPLPSHPASCRPYTIDNDPEYAFADAELNEKGRGQATALQQQTASLAPELLVVSPMRRATLTGLMAFEEHVTKGALPVLAHELCHERAGRHTCDKRLPKAQLAELYPAVSYELINSEDDPYWGDGVTREPWKDLGVRAGEFAAWLFERPESRVAVAAHSAILLALFNAVFECDDENTSTWFGTGEMRTVLLTQEAA